MENNIEGPQRIETSRAATHRAAEYSEDRSQMEKGLSDRYLAVQKSLSELKSSKEKGAEVAAKHNHPALDDLAIRLRKAAMDEIEDLELKQKDIEGEMLGKGMNPGKYTMQ